MRRPAALALASAAALCAACGSSAAPSDPPVGAAAAKRIATGLQVPWGVAFLPGGGALVSERTTGRIMRVPAGGGKPRVAMRVPGVDTGAGEGGLLGIALSPRYRSDKLVYAYLTTSSDNRIVRFRLGGRLRPVLTGLDHSFVHNGGRIAFGPDGKLYAGVGDAGDTGHAQDMDSQNGKILRMNPDGSVPSDNPFPGSRVWSLGHRNVQGLTWDRAGRLWATEFGQNSFDEVNLIRKGKNYGWPTVEGRGSTDGGRFVNPKVTWRTSESSPSGVAFSRGRLYVGALQGECVWRIPLSGTRAGKPRKLVAGTYGRIRTVQRAPGGALWITTSNRDGRGDRRPGDDRIIRLPAR
jgi:glucose/arabinose dehydrogenase